LGFLELCDHGGVKGRVLGQIDHTAYLGARFRDRRKRLLLEFGDASHGFHQIGYQIVAALILIFNLRPGGLHNLIFGDHAVVEILSTAVSEKSENNNN